MDPRTMTLGSDRWLTDSRVYNLVWLGRWIERAQSVARVLLWAARQESANGEGIGLEEVLRMAASVRGVSIEPGESALDALLTRDSGASLQGLPRRRPLQRDSRRPGRGGQDHRRGYRRA